jgi:ATP-dependent RNA helicase DeaD
VVNYHLPDAYESYVHRSGRTARAGANFINGTQEEEVQEIADFEKNWESNSQNLKKMR